MMGINFRDSLDDPDQIPSFLDCCVYILQFDCIPFYCGLYDHNNSAATILSLGIGEIY
jgi:hypothetical protein